MAEVVLGLGTSHGPMLHTPPEQWGLRVEADKVSKALCYKGKLYDFPTLVSLRKPGFALEMQLEERKRRLARCHAAIAALAARYTSTRVDLAVIVGNDQRELFLDDLTPPITVYFGKTIENIPASDDQKKKMPPGIAVAEPGHCPPAPAVYPGAPEFGRHLIQSFMRDEFDVAVSERLPPGSEWRNGIPHAYGFVYRQIMGDAPPPSVPIVLNVFFPPNQPSIKRCLALGKSLARAIGAWKGNERIALIGSGGLSHFVVDEELDAAYIDAMLKGDEGRLVTLAEDLFQSGSGEMKNWLPVASAMNALGFKMHMVDYVPCYRSDAGTGVGMAFAEWGRP